MGVMRLPLALACLAVAGCGPARSAPPEPAQCGPAVPETAQHPIVMPPAALSGNYQLIQVQTQPASGTISSGRLHLALPDSAYKAGAMGAAVRELVGWLEPAAGDSTRRRPAVVLAGRHLRLGPGGYPEGSAHHLEITAVADDGFWGWWSADRGLAVVESGSQRVLPDPAGYFCALRLDR
jgi:hypothetical protein